MPDNRERKQKVQLVRKYLQNHGLDAVVLATRSNFAWLTAGGDNHVVSQDELGVGALLVRTQRNLLLADRIEADRLANEEPVQGFDVRGHPWTTPLSVIVARNLKGKKAASDTPAATGLPPLPGDFADEVRASLCDGEIRRYKALGRDCSLAIETVARQINPGDSGFQVEADLARHLLARGIQPHVVLIAFDERMGKYRHPVPTANHLRKYAMLVVCGKRHGLIASCTRLVHFGAVPEGLQKRLESCCRVEAAYWRATTPGATWAQAFRAGMKQYKVEGFDKEWELHHQGGPTGYSGRDFFATTKEERKVRVHQAVAWNPSITGVKSEDTIVVNDQGHEVITACTPNWPTVKVKLKNGYELQRPGILVR